MSTNHVLQLPPEVRELWRAQQALAKHYGATGLKFTLDGRLVGDIAEALALEWFDLSLPEKRTGGVDAVTPSKKTVQIKATGKSRTGPAFTPGTGRAEHLLFFSLDYVQNTATIIYNGPESRVRALLPQEDWTGTKVISLVEIKKLSATVKSEESLPLLAAPRSFKV